MKVNNDYEMMLVEVARQGLAHVSSELLKQVAEGLWYEKWVPDLSLVPEPYQQDAGYLVDRLLRFNVLTKEQKLAVLSALEPYKPHESQATTNSKDPLALQWGARDDLTSRFPELMPLQTRQYAQDKAQALSKTSKPE